MSISLERIRAAALVVWTAVSVSLAVATPAAQATTRAQAHQPTASKSKGHTKGTGKTAAKAHAKAGAHRHVSDAPALSEGERDAQANARLVAEFSPWLGSDPATQKLADAVRDQRDGQPGGATAATATSGSSMPWGEVRLALKMAQGALNREGIAHPTLEQAQAALFGGSVTSDQGEHVLTGVIPARAQGASWAALAEVYGLTVQDLLPPPQVARLREEHSPAHATVSKHQAKKPATKQAKKHPAGKAKRK